MKLAGLPRDSSRASRQVGARWRREAKRPASGPFRDRLISAMWRADIEQYAERFIGRSGFGAYGFPRAAASLQLMFLRFSCSSAREAASGGVTDSAARFYAPA